MNTQFKNQLTASSFIHWYFSDSDVFESFGQRAIKMLEDEGFVNISIRQLFEECGYIPQFICEDAEGDNEYSSEEVEFIND